MHRIFKTLFPLFIAMVCIGLAIGSAPAAAKDVLLTQESVSRFLASFAEMRALALREGLTAATDGDLRKNPIGVVLKAIKSSKLRTEAETIAANNGFSTLKDWLDHGRAVAQAYVYITAGSSRGAAKAAVAQHKDDAMKALDKLGILNDKQKQKARENIDGLAEQLAKEPPPENTAIVRQMKPEIDAAVKAGAS